MNDVEELLRAELQARVAAAEARQVDEQPTVLLGVLARRIRRARARRRWTGSALCAAAVAAAIALPLALLSPGTRISPSVVPPRATVPLSDMAATPSGWAPIAYGKAQISVPADWRVSRQPVCGRVGHGYVVIGAASTSLVVRNPSCKQASNMAAIQVLPPGQGQTHRRSGQINGIPVLGVRPVARGYASFLAPTLHVLITVRGPLANKVLGTLTRSPFLVVIEAGPRLPVPPSWRWHDFGGIRFAVPARWRITKSSVWYPCWGVITSTQAVELVNATRAVAFSCASPQFIASGMRPSHGVVVGAGRYVSLHGPARYRCESLRGLRTCFGMPSPGRPLELAIYMRGRHKPIVFEVGLKGNGLEARTIVESIRPR